MKRCLLLMLTLAALVVSSKHARADDEWPEQPARTGFQMALRGDYAIPFGSTQSGLKQSDAFGGRVTPFFFDIGYKPRRHFFVGGYFGFGVGGCGDAIPAGNNGCGTATARVGAELIYSFLPAARLNPWVGYGIGIEWVGMQGTNAGSFFGPEIGNFMGGFDVRVSRGLGLGRSSISASASTRRSACRSTVRRKRTSTKPCTSGSRSACGSRFCREFISRVRTRDHIHGFFWRVLWTRARARGLLCGEP